MAILIVEDEDETRESIVDLLNFAGHTVLAASDGFDGLKYLKERDEEIALMLVDFMMPGMNGEEFIRRAWAAGFRKKALLVTAVAPWKTTGLAEFGIGYMRKPYDGKALLDTVKLLLGKEN